MQESQYKIYNEIEKEFKNGLYDNRTKTMIYIAYLVIFGCSNQFDFFVKKAIKYGANKRDFLNILYCIVQDEKLLDSIMEFLKILDNNFIGEMK